MLVNINYRINVFYVNSYGRALLWITLRFYSTLMQWRQTLKKCYCCFTDSRRARLHTRDRLSATDYMKTLAGMDRNLAMDKILEQRRIQQRSHSNVYVDDVFVDISRQAQSRASPPASQWWNVIHSISVVRFRGCLYLITISFVTKL